MIDLKKRIEELKDFVSTPANIPGGEKNLGDLDHILAVAAGSKPMALVWTLPKGTSWKAVERCVSEYGVKLKTIRNQGKSLHPYDVIAYRDEAQIKEPRPKGRGIDRPWLEQRQLAIFM